MIYTYIVINKVLKFYNAYSYGKLNYIHIHVYSIYTKYTNRLLAIEFSAQNYDYAIIVICSIYISILSNLTTMTISLYKQCIDKTK